MKILIVSATKLEVQSLLNQMETTGHLSSNQIQCIYKKIEIDFLITGIGMVATTYFTSKSLNNKYAIALNLGICGSFNTNLEIGAVVNIVQDHFSELGAEDGEQFLSIKEIGLEGKIEMFNETYIKNNVLDEIPKVCGITVNTVLGNEKSIENVFNKFHLNTESMEGAAFMFVCEKEQIPYAQIRAVSNFVERRNKNNWNIPLAIENLNKKVLEILDSL
jgi:futalosine hydrolase